LITYCRVRPARSIGPAWAETCRREGTTTVETAAPSADEIAAALGAGLLPVGGPGASGVAAWWCAGGGGVARHRRHRWMAGHRHRPGRPKAVGRRCAAAVPPTCEPAAAGGLRCVPARGPGRWCRCSPTPWPGAGGGGGRAGDLLLRDWDTERLGELRDTLAGRLLIERAPSHPGGLRRCCRRSRTGAAAAHLDLVDASGVMRLATRGRRAGTCLAGGPGRLSAEWPIRPGDPERREEPSGPAWP